MRAVACCLYHHGGCGFDDKFNSDGTKFAALYVTIIIILIIFLSVRVCVHPLWEVSGNDLTPRNKRLYLWPLNNRG